VDDVTNPVVTCPTDIIMPTDAGLCTAVVNYTASATDNCTSVPALSYSIAAGTAFEKGSTPVTVTADDGNDNTATCTFNVVVNDEEDPMAAPRRTLTRLPLAPMTIARVSPTPSRPAPPTTIVTIATLNRYRDRN